MPREIKAKFNINVFLWFNDNLIDYPIIIDLTQVDTYSKLFELIKIRLYAGKDISSKFILSIEDDSNYFTSITNNAEI